MSAGDCVRLPRLDMAGTDLHGGGFSRLDIQPRLDIMSYISRVRRDFVIDVSGLVVSC